MPSGRTTIDLLRTSKFLVKLVPGPAILKVKVEHCICKPHFPRTIHQSNFSLTLKSLRMKKLKRSMNRSTSNWLVYWTDINVHSFWFRKHTMHSKLKTKWLKSNFPWLWEQKLGCWLDNWTMDLLFMLGFS